ncbi:MAG: heme exporter protein CcmB [Candidatus Heimdallarchaeota archaeon]
MGASISEFQRIKTLTVKDIRLLFRRKHEMISLILFSAIALLAFSYSLGPFFLYVDEVIPALLWVILFFTIMLNVPTSFAREIDKGTLDGLKSTPISPQAILAAKMFFSIVVVACVEIILVPLSIILFNYELAVVPAIGLLIIGSLDLAFAGCIVGALTMHTEAKSILIPILMFPIIIPALLPVVVGTEKTLAGANFHEIAPELVFVGSHFLIILILSLFLIGNLFET